MTFDAARHLAHYNDLKRREALATERLEQAETVLRAKGGVTPKNVVRYARLLQLQALASIRVLYLHVCRMDANRTVVLGRHKKTDLSMPSYIAGLANENLTVDQIKQRLTDHVCRAEHSMSAARLRLYHFIKFSHNSIFKEEEQRNEELAKQLAAGAAHPVSNKPAKRAAEEPGAEEPPAKREVNDQ